MNGLHDGGGGSSSAMAQKAYSGSTRLSTWRNGKQT
jgi:hypothetical protein